ncbi:hypothetical protein [Flagellimonas sp.]|uniref:hypothetical protein n=1 Tax=Flagellimonas sp. TaxID=2058762 RepID=UPI003AB5439A
MELLSDSKFYGPAHVCDYLHKTAGITCNLVSSNTNFGELFRGVNQLVIGTGENDENILADIVSTASRRGILITAIIDAPTSIRERLQSISEYPSELINRVVFSDPVCREKLRQLGFQDENLFLVRNPQIDYVEKFLHNRKLSAYQSSGNISSLPGKKLLFISEISDGMCSSEFKKSEDYTLLGNDIGASGRTQVVLEEVISVLEDIAEDISLSLRMHPKDNINKYLKYISKIDYFSIDEHPLDAVFQADLVVGLTSSLLSEAAAMGKPVLSVVPRKKEAKWLGQFVSPAIPTVWTRKNLSKELNLLVQRGVSETQRTDNERPCLLDVLR